MKILTVAFFNMMCCELYYTKAAAAGVVRPLYCGDNYSSYRNGDNGGRHI